MRRVDPKKRKPWMKFYPADWQSDDGLKQCSLTAQGLWIGMIAIMHKSEIYGHLLIAGVNPSAAQLAASIGKEPKVVKAALEELESWRVFSRTAEGIIYSRRMVADAEKEERDRTNGSEGGNPQLRRQPPPEDNPPVDDGLMAGDNRTNNQGVNPPDKAQIPEARNQIPEEESSLRSLSAREADAEFEAWWKLYPLKVGKGQARPAYARARRKASAEVLAFSVRNARWPAEQKFIPHPSTWLNGERWLDQRDTFDPVLRAAGLEPEDFDFSEDYGGLISDQRH